MFIQGDRKPFKEVIKHFGDPQAFGQPPITSLRQVGAYIQTSLDQGEGKERLVSRVTAMYQEENNFISAEIYIKKRRDPISAQLVILMSAEFKLFLVKI